MLCADITSHVSSIGQTSLHPKRLLHAKMRAPSPVQQLKNQSSPESEGPTMVCFGIERRFYDILNVRCDLKVPHHLEAAKQLGGILIIETRAKSVLVRLTPVETQPKQTIIASPVISEPGADRFLQKAASVISIARSYKGHPFIIKGMLKRKIDAPAI